MPYMQRMLSTECVYVIIRSTNFMYVFLTEVTIGFQDLDHAVCTYCREPFRNVEETVRHCATTQMRKFLICGKQIYQNLTAPVCTWLIYCNGRNLIDVIVIVLKIYNAK